MKSKAGFIVPVLMLLLGIYALLAAFNSSGEQVVLISGQAIPRGLTFMLGAIGIGGGAVVLVTMLNEKKSAT
jgi:hypothetical protein